MGEALAVTVCRAVQDDAQEEQVHRKCSVKGCGFETVKTEPENARLMLGFHYLLAQEQLL